MNIALRYVGDGEYIHGVPARDLSAEEAERYADAIAAAQLATGRVLYERVKGSKKKGTSEKQ